MQAGILPPIVVVGVVYLVIVTLTMGLIRFLSYSKNTLFFSSPKVDNFSFLKESFPLTMNHCRPTFLELPVSGSPAAAAAAGTKDIELEEKPEVSKLLQ